ncbi:MAG: hypothetical protein IJ678_03135, partial [Kiritimatiellae bacterium]|nr:hypothetical protein [Kiritimatiellia bacterium]
HVYLIIDRYFAKVKRKIASATIFSRRAGNPVQRVMSARQVQAWNPWFLQLRSRKFAIAGQTAAG